MRRAVVFALILLAAPAVLPATLRAAGPNTVDGTGMVDYSRAPDLQVGSWVKYRMQGSSLRGFKDDYTLTLLVAGEEMWWGEPCFWIETWTEDAGQPRRAVASLMPYAMFGDSMATKHTTWFLRKTIEGIGPDGQPKQMINRRDAGDLAIRRGARPADPVEVSRDTLGRDTTTVPAGHFEALKVRHGTRLVEQVTKGDSTIYYERTESRVQYLTPRIPITSLARELVDDHQQGRSWKLGESNKAGPLVTLERARGDMALVGYGTSGLTAELVPASKRRSLKEQAATGRATAAPTRKAPARKSGS